MTLSVSIATIAWFLKKSTLSCHYFETFQPKIGQCDISPSAYCAFVNKRGLLLRNAWCVYVKNNKTFLSARERKFRASSGRFLSPPDIMSDFSYQHLNEKFKSERIPKRIPKTIPKWIPKRIRNQFQKEFR